MPLSASPGSSTITSYPTNKQQLSAAPRSHLLFVTETETETRPRLWANYPITTRGVYFVSSTADMIVPLVPTPAASIVSINPDTVAQEYGCDIAPQRHLREPATTLSSAMTRWTGHWSPSSAMPRLAEVNTLLVWHAGRPAPGLNLSAGVDDSSCPRVSTQHLAVDGDGAVDDQIRDVHCRDGRDVLVVHVQISHVELHRVGETQGRGAS